MELSVHEEKILSSLRRWKQGEADRASDAGDMRQEIGDLLELTGLNKKALAFIRMLDKMTPEKRTDVLRSLDPLLDLMEGAWDGQKTPDMFEDAPEPEGESIADEADAFDKHLAEVAAE